MTQAATRLEQAYVPAHGADLIEETTIGDVILTLGAIQTQSTQVLMPTFNPGLQLELIESERSAIFAGVATMLRAMLDHPNFSRTDFSSVTVALSGGAFVEPSLAREVEARVGAPLVITYGQTECSPSITMTHPDDSSAVRTTTVGRVLPGVELKIADLAQSARVVSVGEVGQICTRGYHVMIGYHDDPIQTAETIDSDRWLNTGDLAIMDAAGNVQIVGRLKDMIIRGGENIYPSEVETALLGHDAVAEVAVIGVPDDYWGEVVGAFVRLIAGAQISAEELNLFVSRRLAKQKVPQRWYFVDDFPLTASGKILKTELREKSKHDPGHAT
jgi:acyl-CoA synthetase (AMP-forming)/AMP-acid ligase II